MILPTTLGDHGEPLPPTPRPPVHHKPRLTALLETLRLDVSYHRGAGCQLYSQTPDGGEIEVLDLVGGYGSLLLGHNHPELVAEARQFFDSGRPIHSQGSQSKVAEYLARELSRRAGDDYCVVFGNSGTESVEAALKHAMLETGSRTFIALERAFHGKTWGALQLTAHPVHRSGWESPDLTVLRVPLNDVAALERAFRQAGRPAGFLFEPVQGEGGVHLMEPAFAQRAAALCRESGAPLIADECQTGIGRTGTFLACEQLGVQPDYVVLAKALGGGLAKISALLVRRSRYRDTFDLKHTSTFAGDEFSCTIALRALHLITPELMTACRERGQRLLDGLQRLAARHPAVIAGVRGLGLIAAIQFRPLTDSPSFVLRFLSAQHDLAYAVASHLLARHRLRVAPTLSDRFTLRLQPPALINEAEITRVLEALDSVCRLLSRGRAADLSRHVVESLPSITQAARGPRDDGRAMAFNEGSPPAATTSRPVTRVAWLCHLVDADDLVSLDASFGSMSRDERELLLAHWVPLAAPVLMSRVAIRSARGPIVEFHPILLPFTSRWVKGALDARTVHTARSLVQQGVQAAADFGCSLVALGQYTSIVTGNGTRLDPSGPGLTTGNSYAIALAIQAVELACWESGVVPAESTVVIAGASGNIGRTCAHILGRRFRRLVLVGSSKPGSLLRLQAIAATLPNVTIATDLAAACRGDVVVTAVNSVDVPLQQDHLAPGAIVCDLSVPASLSPDLARRRPDLRLIKGGIAAMPFQEDLGIAGFPLPRGQAYACMAEAMLLGFEGSSDRYFTGTLSPEHVEKISRLADAHGFTLAALKKTCVLGSDRHETALALTR